VEVLDGFRPDIPMMKRAQTIALLLLWLILFLTPQGIIKAVPLLRHITLLANTVPVGFPFHLAISV
jgi:hypothetical protein